ncbi:MAG TPA: hypothetical protein GX405_09285, partial [Rhizobiales bacterium]|nr:hypothetical protein [Hyphomicrobiales bacterium]
MRLHVAFAAMLMSGTTLALVPFVPASAQEDVIVLDDDGASDSAETATDASTESASDDAGADGMGTLSGAANFRTLGINDVLLPDRNYGGLVTL